MSKKSQGNLTRRAFLASSAAGVSLTVLHPFSARAAAGQAHLRIMETTDLHVHVWPYDYYADRAVDTMGLARTAAHIDAIRTEATNSILLDNGDFLQGNPMGDYMAYERGMQPGEVHPVIKALNTLGFDAATLGNHEFNYGLDFLDAALAGAEFPVVSANIIGPEIKAMQPRFTPYVLLERTLKDGAGAEFPIRIGVIGFVPPQIMQWDRGHLGGRVNALDIVQTAERLVPEMRAQGAEIVIALAHTGIGSATHTAGMENAAVPLAAVPGIDVVLTGHSHLVFPSKTFEGFEAVDVASGTIHGKPAVMAGFWGDNLGVVDLLLEREGDSWKVAGSSVEVRPIYGRDAENKVVPTVDSVQAVLDATRADHEATLAYVRRAVGKTTAPLHSYFALVADDPSVQIVSQAQTWYITQMLLGTEHEGLPVLSAAAPFKAGGRGGPDYYTDVPTGDIAIKNVADLYLYPNTVRAVRITGQQVKDWLERSAGIFNQVTPGQADQPLLNPDFPSYNFDVIDGVSYRIDLSQPSKYDSKGGLLNEGANRITDLTHNGQPVDPAQEFVIATNNYRASGGGAFPGADGSTIIFEGPDTNRDVIVRFIVSEGTINPSADANWSFAPLPGTSVLFETGPRAAEHLGDVKGVSIEAAGDGEGGFARYRISL